MKIFLIAALFYITSSYAFNIVGTWKLISIEKQYDHQWKIDCNSPTGMLIYTADGFMSAGLNCIQASYSRPSFTPEDTFYMGTYTIKGNEIIHPVKTPSGAAYYSKDLPRQIQNISDQKINLLVKNSKGETIRLKWQKISNLNLQELKDVTNPLYPFSEKNTHFESLNPLLENTTILGLGEATHGTHEFYLTKIQLIKDLIIHKGFNIVAIEANMPAAYQLNDYVLNKKGNLQELIKWHFWLYQTKEFLSFIEWLRDYNKTAKNKVQLVGFDMQSPYASLNILHNFMTKLKNKDLEEKVNSITKQITTLDHLFMNQKAITKKSVELVQSETASLKNYLLNEKTVLINSYGLDSFNWISQNLSLINQYIKYLLDSYQIRDRAMAENLQWILQQNPHSKIIIWAHNGHIQKTKSGGIFFTPMGQYLFEKFNDRYRAIGFTSYEGNFLSTDLQNLKLSDKFHLIVKTASLEDYLNQLGYDVIFLNLLKARKEDKPGILLQPLYWHLDALTPNQFSRQNISPAFDGIIFIKKTSPAKLAVINFH